MMFPRIVASICCVTVLAGSKCGPTSLQDQPEKAQESSPTSQTHTSPSDGEQTRLSSSRPGPGDTGQEPGGVVLPIDSAEEAIQHAETDRDVRSFKRHCAWKGFKVDSYAKLDPDKGVWVVVFYAGDVRDLWFEVQLKPDGTFVLKKDGDVR